EVDLADIDEAPRPKLELQKALTIGAQGHFVIDTGDEVAEMRRWQILARNGLEIENVDGILRAGDQVLQLARRPNHRVGQLGRGRWGLARGGATAQPESGPCQDSRELPAARCTLKRRWHGDIPSCSDRILEQAGRKVMPTTWGRASAGICAVSHGRCRARVRR